MNNTDSKYNSYALVREMMETTEVIRQFDPAVNEVFIKSLKSSGRLFLTGEGSSRIFPAKRLINSIMKEGLDLKVVTEGSTQAREYKLDDYTVFGASNSGQTKEVIKLIKSLKEKGHMNCFGLTANKGTLLEQISDDTHILNCGREDAVAATKSVIEQGLFYDALVRQFSGRTMADLDELALKVETALTTQIDNSLTELISSAEIIYFAGRNTGVAEELTLKTNEITRKKSEFLEGTYGVHGIEEVMDSNELVIWINPFPAEEKKFRECLVDGVGLNIIAVADHQTSFPTILIPEDKDYSEYIELAAGWNILVETGLALGIDLDKPERARKVGNEFED